MTDFPDLDRDLPLLTVASVAEYLSVDETTVRRLVKRGEIRGRHVGDTVRVSPRDLRDYLCRAVIHVPKPLPPLPSPPSGPGARGSRWWCAGTARGSAAPESVGARSLPRSIGPTGAAAEGYHDGAVQAHPQMTKAPGCYAGGLVMGVVRRGLSVTGRRLFGARRDHVARPVVVLSRVLAVTYKLLALGASVRSPCIIATERAAVKVVGDRRREDRSG